MGLLWLLMPTRPMASFTDTCQSTHPSVVGQIQTYQVTTLYTTLLKTFKSWGAPKPT